MKLVQGEKFIVLSVCTKNLEISHTSYLTAELKVRTKEYKHHQEEKMSGDKLRAKIINQKQENNTNNQ